MSLVAPSPVPSHGQLAMPFPVPSSMLSTSNLLPIPEELSQTGSRSDGDGDIVEWDNEPERGSDSEEENMDDFLDASGAKPRMKETICDWHKL